MTVGDELRALLILGGIMAAGIAVIVALFQLQPETRRPPLAPTASAAEAPAEPPKDDWRIESEAKTLCRLAVINSLKAPSTADFVTMTAWETESHRWTVRGQLDAQNVFGAMVRSHFACELFDAATGWRVKRVVVE